jgi:hypothetical protein|tara:strand:+ start:1945 stop:2532 length:588 start_codon:yes stop_codon:yes gene_type:complete
MANKDRAFGLRPVRKLSGDYYAGGQNKFTIANNYGTAIYQGDIVSAVTAGNVERIAAGGSGYVLGVFNGCFYTDPSTSKPTWSNKYPASTAAADVVAFVVTDPNIICEIQGDAAFPRADLFGNFDIVDSSPVGDTYSGRSHLELGVSTGATTATHPLKAIEISQDPENSDVGNSNTNVLVTINNSLFSAGTTGLA